MKIAYVYDTIYPYTLGGVEKRIWELSRRLTAKGHVVHIFGPKFWEGPSSIQKEGIQLHGVCEPPKERFINGRRSITWPLKFSVFLFPSLMKEKFDIVDCQNFPYLPCFSAKVASVIKRYHFLVTWHEVWANYWYEYLGKSGILGKTVEKLVTFLSVQDIAVSQPTKITLEAICAKKRIQVIPNGIDLGAIKQVKPSSEISDIIFVGRIIKEKNVDILVRSVNLIKKEIPLVKVFIIGDGPEKNQIEKIILNLGLKDNVIMLGRIEADAQVYSYMKSSKVFVSLSTREGFGIVALEANACGLPVVCVKHDRNAMVGLITEGYNGFILDDVKEQSLARKLISAEETSNDLREKCLASAELNDWDVIAEKVNSFYKLVIANKIRNLS